MIDTMGWTFYLLTAFTTLHYDVDLDKIPYDPILLQQISFVLDKTDCNNWYNVQYRFNKLYGINENDEEVDQDEYDPDKDLHGWIADIIKQERNNVKELKDCPPSIDILLFPPVESINAAISYNSRYQDYIKGYALFYPHKKQTCEDIIDEAVESIAPYELIRSCHNQMGKLYNRMKLRELKELIGPDNYYRGNLLPNVPLQRFQQKSTNSKISS